MRCVASPRIRLIDRKLEHGAIQSDRGITNRELSGVHSDRDTASTRIYIVAREPALPALVQLACSIECERMRGNHLSVAQMLVNTHRIRNGHRAPRISLLCPAAARLP